MSAGDIGALVEIVAALASDIEDVRHIAETTSNRRAEAVLAVLEIDLHWLRDNPNGARWRERMRIALTLAASVIVAHEERGLSRVLIV